MITGDMKELRSCIEEALTKLEGAARNTKSDLRESGDVGCKVFQDQLDCAKAEADIQTASLVYNENIENRNRLMHALVRLKNGTYETCIICGDEIGLDRLKACPTAVRCISCQEVIETVSYVQFARAVKAAENARNAVCA